MSEQVYPTVDPAAEQGCEHGHIGACTACFAEDERARNEARIEELEDQLALRDREIARLAAHRLAVAQKVGIAYQADGHADEPGPDEIVIATIDRLVFERNIVLARLEKSTDWYRQRFNRLRKWVKEEVEPLSADAARRYYAICANGSPAPHESADWTDTLHAARLERDAAIARVKELEAGPGVRFSQTPGGDDGDFVCSNCGLIVPDEECGHTWEACAKDLAEDRVRIIDGMCDDVGRELNKNEALEARIRELTEWRPMETAPKRQCYVLVLQRGDVTMRLRYPDTDGSYDGWNKGWLNNDTDEAVGWLPLPEVPRG